MPHALEPVLELSWGRNWDKEHAHVYHCLHVSCPQTLTLSERVLDVQTKVIYVLAQFLLKHNIHKVLSFSS